MQLKLNLEAKNGRRYTILKSKNWFLTFYIIKWTRKTLPEIAVPKSLVPNVEDAEREHLHHLPPHDDIKFFWLHVYLKNIFALEPHMKLATFVVEEVIYQNVKKKVKKIIPRRCNCRRRKRGQKTGNFKNRYFSHIKFTKNMFKDFFRIQRHQMII